jgi:hypothetical protein
MRVVEEAEIYAELQVDSAPSPAAVEMPAAAAMPIAAAPTIPAAGGPLAKANQVVAPPPEAQGASSERWLFVRWDAPVEIQVGVPYWVVLKGIRGRIYLGLESDAARPAAAGAGRAVREERLRINRGGQLWKAFQRGDDDRIRARLALVYTPGADNSVAAVRLGLEGADGTPGPAALIDPGARVTAVALDLGGVTLPGAVLVVQSNAVGALTVANLIQEYRPVAEGGS